MGVGGRGDSHPVRGTGDGGAVLEYADGGGAVLCVGCVGAGWVWAALRVGKRVMDGLVAFGSDEFVDHGMVEFPRASDGAVLHQLCSVGYDSHGGADHASGLCPADIPRVSAATRLTCVRGSPRHERNQVDWTTERLRDNSQSRRGLYLHYLAACGVN
jgi:hypothetical protein